MTVLSIAQPTDAEGGGKRELAGESPCLALSLRAKTEQTLVRGKDNADSRLAIKQMVSFTLSEKGTFVRKIILEELVKGLDALGLASLDSATSAAASRVPFLVPFPSPLMADEDIANLRTLRRLLLLLLKLQKNANTLTKNGGHGGEPGALRDLPPSLHMAVGSSAADDEKRNTCAMRREVLRNADAMTPGPARLLHDVKTCMTP
ncbi:hypothetical protein Taro_019431, partial [Colocasia esculenta]|nr:hypothetical protein [Colocasia esculenta]